MSYKKSTIAAILILVFAFVLLMDQPWENLSVSPVAPGAGWWEVDWWDWDRNDTVTYIPQYELASTVDPDDYALLHTSGAQITGPAKICHTYPGAKYGWNPEFRYLSGSTWIPLETFFNTDEGYLLVCSQVWYKGTYALFGYWEKPIEPFVYGEFVIY